MSYDAVGVVRGQETKKFKYDPGEYGVQTRCITRTSNACALQEVLACATFVLLKMCTHIRVYEYVQPL